MAWRGEMTAVLWVAVGSSIVFGQAAKPSVTSRTLVRAGHLLDIKTGKLLDAQTIVVTGDTIFRWRPPLRFPPNRETQLSTLAV